MNRAERFLIMLCAVAIIMRLMGIKDGLAVQFIGFLLLAVFQLLFTLPLLLAIPFRGLLKRQSYSGVSKMQLFTGSLAGIVFAYLTLSLLHYSTNQIGAWDVISNCGILLALLLAPSVYNYYRKREMPEKRLIIRILIAAVMIGIFVVLMHFLPGKML